MVTVTKNTIKTSLVLDREIWAKVRAEATIRNVNATEIVERALEEYLKNGRK